MTFFHTHVSESSVLRATETLRSTFISEGKLVREFETRLGTELGLSRPVALNSGTTALHLPRPPRMDVLSPPLGPQVSEEGERKAKYNLVHASKGRTE